MKRLINAGLVFGLILAVAAIGCDQPTPPEAAAPKAKPTPPVPAVSKHQGGPPIGSLAPEIVGVDLEGVEFKLTDYRGQVVMLDFYGDW